MATRSTAELNRFADKWEDDLDYNSAVLSGIVGDRAHRRRGGYHISIEDQPADNYSVVRADDKAPPGDWPRDRASAVDMSMNKSDMVKCYKRVHAVWKNRNDPRRRYFNAFNVWDGSGDAVRLDFITNNASYATPDHKWHNHGEFRRRYVNSRKAMEAGLSMLVGESVTQYKNSRRTDTAVPVPTGTPLLRRGSSGATVRQLQKAFNELGYKIATDGDFGPETEQAVERFQRSAGLTVDGIYGPNTATELEEELSMPTVDEFWNTDGVVKAPSASPTADENTHWTAANIIRSNNNFGRKTLHETRQNNQLLTEVLAGQKALLELQQGGSLEDAQQMFRAELDRHRDLTLDELVTALGPVLSQVLTAKLQEVAGDLPQEVLAQVGAVVGAAVEDAANRISLTVTPDPSADDNNDT